MKLYISCDHAGFPLKEAFLKNVSQIQTASGEKVEFMDLGTYSLDSVDYPDYADKLCEALMHEKKLSDAEGPFGVLICGSGVGVSIEANRYSGIRAVLAESEIVAKLSREHNHANVLCLGARIVSTEKAIQILNAFLTATPDSGERHLKRINKLSLRGSKS